jgi:hypothetical protein
MRLFNLENLVADVAFRGQDRHFIAFFVAEECGTEGRFIGNAAIDRIGFSSTDNTEFTGIAAGLNFDLRTDTDNAGAATAIREHHGIIQDLFELLDTALVH